MDETAFLNEARCLRPLRAVVGFHIAAVVQKESPRRKVPYPADRTAMLWIPQSVSEHPRDDKETTFCGFQDSQRGYEDALNPRALFPCAGPRCRIL